MAFVNRLVSVYPVAAYTDDPQCAKPLTGLQLQLQLCKGSKHTRDQLTRSWLEKYSDWLLHVYSVAHQKKHWVAVGGEILPPTARFCTRFHARACVHAVLAAVSARAPPKTCPWTLGRLSSKILLGTRSHEVLSASELNSKKSRATLKLIGFPTPPPHP